jgi:hypothetical protein
MITLMIGGQPPQTNKAVQLNDRMLELAQDLLFEEMIDDSLFACGDGFTSKVAGKYGLYETCNGEVISFQPKSSLNFSLICDEFVVRGDLATIRTITPRLSNYELSIDGS